ncbi:hypothetical protein AUTU_03270 [Aureibacter tunicatorum]|nr:hypothetical protein AUTU_03270 [Aureibacter tunicatorum]
MAAQAVEKNNEQLNFDGDKTLAELENTLLARYAGLEKVPYKLAVNKKLIRDKNLLISEIDELAVLPPFAGG